MNDFPLKQMISDDVLEILESGPLEILIILRPDLNPCEVARLQEKIAKDPAILNKGYSIIYAYDNGRIVDL